MALIFEVGTDVEGLVKTSYVKLIFETELELTIERISRWRRQRVRSLKEHDQPELLWHGGSPSCRERATAERLGRSKITHSLFPRQAELTELMVVTGERGAKNKYHVSDLVTGRGDMLHQEKEWWSNKFLFSFLQQNNESNFMQVIWDTLGHSDMF